MTAVDYVGNSLANSSLATWTPQPLSSSSNGGSGINLGGSVVGSAVGAALDIGNAIWQQNRHLSTAEKEQNEFNAQQAQIAREFNANEAQIARDWQRDMRQTAYQDTTTDMIAAGINPAMLYGSNAGVTSTPSTTAAQGQAAQGGNKQNTASLGDRAIAAYQAYNLGNLQRSQANLTQSQADLNTAQANYYDQHSQNEVRLTKAQVQDYFASASLKIQQAAESGSRIMLNGMEYEVKEAVRDLTRAQRDLADANTVQIQKLTPVLVEVQKSIKELNEKKAEWTEADISRIYEMAEYLHAQGQKVGLDFNILNNTYNNHRSAYEAGTILRGLNAYTGAAVIGAGAADEIGMGVQSFNEWRKNRK